MEPVPELDGVRQSIWVVVIDVISQAASQTVTSGALVASKPVPVMTRGDPPPKLPLEGVAEEISKVEVNMLSSLERPRSAL